MSGANDPNDPASALPAHPSLAWLRKTAKQLLVELRVRNPDARLAEAQLATARRHGFASWRRLVAFVAALDGEGERLRAAVRTGDLASVAAILDERSEAMGGGDPAGFAGGAGGKAPRGINEPALVNAHEDLQERARPSDEPAMSLLHLAVAEGQRAMAELLVARGVRLDARNRGGRTALHDCFELGRDDIARMLIAAGATLDVCAAAAYGEHAALTAILRGDPAQANDLSTGLSPVGWAGYAHDAASAEILVAHGAIVDRPPLDGAAWAPACQVAALPVVRVLLAHGADPNFQDARGRTPLHLVLESRLVRDPTELVRVLLAAGADPDRPDHAGRAALAEAVARTEDIAETYFPKRALGTKQLAGAIALLSAASRREPPSA